MRIRNTQICKIGTEKGYPEWTVSPFGYYLIHYCPKETGIAYGPVIDNLDRYKCKLCGATIPPILILALELDCI